uniref:Uncharacterized protein n=1 Tax=Populus trichocarpa TaxID=3694 RepID=A9P982_POPTR|nr:unknown [Populus trichocarpa]
MFSGIKTGCIHLFIVREPCSAGSDGSTQFRACTS